MLKEFTLHHQASDAFRCGAYPPVEKRAASAAGGPEAVRAGDSEGPYA